MRAGLITLLSLLGVLLATPLGALAQLAEPDVEAPRLDAPSLSGGALRGLDAPTVERARVGGGSPLTLGQVLSSVDRHHPGMTMAREGVRAAEGELLAAEGGFDLGFSTQAYVSGLGYYQYGYGGARLEQPTPFWGATFQGGWRFGQGLDDPDGVPVYRRDFETLDGGELWLEARVPLWQDGPIDARRSRLWQAEHLREAASQDAQTRLIQLRLAASVAYWQWVAAGQRYLVQERLLGIAEERDGQIRARVSAGAIPAIESLENQRVVITRRQALVSARRELERSTYALSLFFRGEDGEPIRPPPERVPADAIEAPATDALASDVTLERGVSLAWSQRPELARYAALAERRRVALRSAENRFAPRIDVSVRGSVDLGSGDERQRTQLADPVVEGSVQIAFPLQFRDARGSIARERAELESLRAETQLTRERIAAEVQDAWSALRAADEAVRLAGAGAQVARAVADAERRRFELGATQLFFVNLREQAAAEAELELVDARARLGLARAQWSAATASDLAP